MLQPAICKFSENALQQVKRRMLVIELCMPVMVAAIFFVMPFSRRNPGAVIGWAILTLVVLEAILIIESAIITRKMKETTLTISAEAMERTGGRFTEKIADGEIREVNIHENPSGEIASIVIKLKNQKIVALGGFDNMALIAGHIENAVSDKSLVHRKEGAVAPDDPWFIVIMAMLALGGVLLIRGMGREVFRVFSILFFLAYGLFILLNKPLTRSLGQRFAKFEIIISAIVIVCAVLLAIGMFR